MYKSFVFLALVVLSTKAKPQYGGGGGQVFQQKLPEFNQPQKHQQQNCKTEYTQQTTYEEKTENICKQSSRSVLGCFSKLYFGTQAKSLLA
jgi:hypothetical protein